MRYSLGTHIHKATPDVLYGNIGQLWVDGSDDFRVWLPEVWTSEPPGQRFGGDLVLGLLGGGEVVGLSRCDLEHFRRDRSVWIENKAGRRGDWRKLDGERLENINTGMPTKGSHLKDKPSCFLFRGSV